MVKLGMERFRKALEIVDTADPLICRVIEQDYELQMFGSLLGFCRQIIIWLLAQQTGHFLFWTNMEQQLVNVGPNILCYLDLLPSRREIIQNKIHPVSLRSGATFKVLNAYHIYNVFTFLLNNKKLFTYSFCFSIYTTCFLLILPSKHFTSTLESFFINAILF